MVAHREPEIRKKIRDILMNVFMAFQACQDILPGAGAQESQSPGTVPKKSLHCDGMLIIRWNIRFS
jgi:hypothetical protein